MPTSNVIYFCKNCINFYNQQNIQCINCKTNTTKGTIVLYNIMEIIKLKLKNPNFAQHLLMGIKNINLTINDNKIHDVISGKMFKYLYKQLLKPTQRQGGILFIDGVSVFKKYVYF